MGLLDDLGLVDAAKARPRGKCSRCGHTHDLANLVPVMDHPMPWTPGDHVTTLLVCRLGCPGDIGPHPALLIRSGLRSWDWKTSCDDLDR